MLTYNLFWLKRNIFLNSKWNCRTCWKKFTNFTFIIHNHFTCECARLLEWMLPFIICDYTITLLWSLNSNFSWKRNLKQVIEFSVKITKTKHHTEFEKNQSFHQHPKPHVFKKNLMFTKEKKLFIRLFFRKSHKSSARHIY